MRNLGKKARRTRNAHNRLNGWAKLMHNREFWVNGNDSRINKDEIEEVEAIWANVYNGGTYWSKMTIKIPFIFRKR